MNIISSKGIYGYFSKITASWSKYHMAYTNKRMGLKKKKKLQMELVYREEDPQNQILRFLGGPTGHEAYYVKDLLKQETFPKPKYFCICAGTVNSWEKCEVEWEKVLKFLKDNGWDVK